MSEELISIDDLIPDAANARKHTDRNRKAVEDSVARFGAARSIVIDAKGVVRAGNTTLEAARAAGITSVRVVECDGNTLLAAKRSDWTETEAVTYSIADNQTGADLHWNNETLQDILPTLPHDLLAATGFSLEEVERLMTGSVETFTDAALPGAGTPVQDPSREWEGMPAFEHNDEQSFRKLTVHFRDQDAVEAFERAIGQRVGPTARFVWYPAGTRHNYGAAE